MLKPVEIDIRWHAPINAADALDQTKYGSLGGVWPGVYIHLFLGKNHELLGSYIGKHQSSVAWRQFDHFAAYRAGSYSLLDNSGNVVFRGGSRQPANFNTLTLDHLSRMTVMFGEMVSVPGPLATFADATEGLLHRSPAWKANGGTRLNVGQGSATYQMFDRFELRHTGSPQASVVFGPSTIWERSTQQIF